MSLEECLNQRKIDMCKVFTIHKNAVTGKIKQGLYRIALLSAGVLFTLAGNAQNGNPFCLLDGTLARPGERYMGLGERAVAYSPDGTVLLRDTAVYEDADQDEGKKGRCTPEKNPNANMYKDAEGKLTICLQNGKLLTFQDNPQDGEAHSIHSASYYPEVNAYLHEDLGWEWVALALINADTGETIQVDGAPVFSPNQKCFMTGSDFDATCYFSIYRVHQDKAIEQTFSIKAGYDPGSPGILSEHGLYYYPSESDDERVHFEQALCFANKRWIDDRTILLEPAEEAPKGTTPTKLIYRENNWQHANSEDVRPKP